MVCLLFSRKDGVRRYTTSTTFYPSSSRSAVFKMYTHIGHCGHSTNPHCLSVWSWMMSFPADCLIKISFNGLSEFRSWYLGYHIIIMWIVSRLYSCKLAPSGTRFIYVCPYYVRWIGILVVVVNIYSGFDSVSLLFKLRWYSLGVLSKVLTIEVLFKIPPALEWCLRCALKYV